MNILIMLIASAVLSGQCGHPTLKTRISTGLPRGRAFSAMPHPISACAAPRIGLYGRAYVSSHGAQWRHARRRTVDDHAQ
jgi:hypothetical protein